MNDSVSPCISTLITLCLRLLGMPKGHPGDRRKGHWRYPNQEYKEGEARLKSGEAASTGEAPAAYIPTSPAPAETPFHTLVYIYISGSVGSRLVADRVRSEVRRKLA